ncbi:MAG: ImmA/IrrE family metallo-endopeptidase [Thermomonas sp.]|uniref:ImmA/IrrE family metallo-endopeptidase n=1 Tax=Thermomonas sp. TaxID=1971895 RepID=UPI002603FDF8|nr:ImmA/IrrE family metallo-endopeptidase [Thermomonas sp.]MCC7097454.1 ImmA/IrrE family metallo-endopeptidase [Thermomonas sp.]
MESAVVDNIEKRLATLRSASTIEARAHEVHLELWNNRYDLFVDKVPSHPLESVEPAVALSMKGFRVVTDPCLGEMWNEGRRVRVAGVVDQDARLVKISPNLDGQERRFTTGHELGHVVEHPGMTLHRDRALSGHMPRKDNMEREADLFSSCFLMPARHVLNEFYARFGMHVFRMNEDTAFGFLLGNYQGCRKKIKLQRDASILSATASHFMGRHFLPLNQFFGVSPVAMAIRLEEVGLVEPDSAKWVR